MNNRAATRQSHRDRRPLKESLGEDHRSSTLEKVRMGVSEILTRDEAIVYIAIQQKPLVLITPDCIVLTNRRFIIYRPKLLGGVNFDDHLWREVKAVKLSEGIMGSTFKIITDDGDILSVDYLPRSQARRLYSLTREMEEKIRAQAGQCDATALDGCGLECRQPSAQVKRSSGKRGKAAKVNRTRTGSKPKSRGFDRAKQVPVG